MITDINSEDRLVQQTFEEYLREDLHWESFYAFNTETFGPSGTLGRLSERDVVLRARPPGCARPSESATYQRRLGSKLSRS